MASEQNDFQEITAFLSAADQSLVKELHGQALSLGCIPKISLLNKKPHNWKCEYFLDKKNQLYILQIADGAWSIRGKLYHIAQYSEVLETCNTHTKKTLIKNAKNCGSHGGGCKGPVEFTLEGKKYLKCRHSLLFDHITREDLDSLKTLLQHESRFTAHS